MVILLEIGLVTWSENHLVTEWVIRMATVLACELENWLVTGRVIELAI